MPVEHDRRPWLAAAQAADHDRCCREHLVENLDLHPDLGEASCVEAGDLGGVARGALDLHELEREVAEAVGVDVLDHEALPFSAVCATVRRSTDGLEVDVERPVHVDGSRVARDEWNALRDRDSADESVVDRAAGNPEAREPSEQRGGLGSTEKA